MKTKYCLGIIIALFVVVFAYTFDAKLNMGGDNCVYYIYSTSIVQGEGYSDISALDAKPSNTFPPGYPLLMTAVRIFTDSIIAQKILNGLFLLASAILVFMLAQRIFKDNRLALALGMVALLNYRVLEFASIMMSEMSYLMFSVIVIFLAYLLTEKHRTVKPWWRDIYFYLLIIASAYSFEIRTQGVTLIVAVFVYFLFNKKWLQAVVYGVGTYIAILPWSIRNVVSNVGGSRYIDQIFMVNQWRPEEGYVSIGEVVRRGFETLQMLLAQAIPASIMPYMSVDYAAKATFGQWLVALLLIALIIYGLLSFKKLSVLLISYVVLTVGIICLWSAPSENRYLTTILPFLEIGLVMGVYSLVMYLVNRKGSKRSFSILWLLIPVAFLVYPQLKAQHIASKQEFPSNFTNFFKIAQAVKKNAGTDVVVCSRKPQLFYMYSQTYCCNYKYSSNQEEVIQGLINSKVDYVVLDQLGYSSTQLYLWPAIEANQELFPVVMHLPNPDTYLLGFDRDKAIEKLKNEATF